MKLFVFRNTTVEPLFKNFHEVNFSGYSDISFLDSDYDGFIWFYVLPPYIDKEKIVKELESYKEKISLLVDMLPKSKKVILFTLTRVFSVSVYGKEENINSLICDFNKHLADICFQKNNIYIFDFNIFVNDLQIGQKIDWRFYYLSGIVLNPKIATQFVQWLNNNLNSITGNRKKCLVLDLDNTLWGGVIGEDGKSGIKLGGAYPGNAFKQFQEDILLALQNGVILTICSKNNENDVLEFINEHPEQVLKREHFSNMKINWEKKADNIIDIAKELNIGLDSLVFIDDNPVERGIVKELIPEVTIPDFPTEPYMLKEFFKEVYEKYFMSYELTNEDRQKTEQYKIIQKRKEEKSNFSTFEEYLKSLETEILLMKANEFNILRISQMTQKTNQFNLTTIRYSIEQIKEILNNKNKIFCASVKDRFGDNGITALVIFLINKEDNSAEINSYLLSCRVLGREIETGFLLYSMNLLFEEGITKFKAKYIRTEKNQQVLNFYEKLGFLLISESMTIKEYEFVMKSKNQIKDLYKIEEKND